MAKYRIEISYDKAPSKVYDNLSREGMMEQVRKIKNMSFDGVRNAVIIETETGTTVEIITESGGKVEEYKIGDFVKAKRSTTGNTYSIKDLDGVDNCAIVFNVDDVGNKLVLTRKIDLSALYKVND